MKLNIMVTALFGLVFSLPAIAQESTREDFQQFCAAFRGRWVGDVTWVTDMPGLGRKGEKAIAYVDSKVTHDGNALVATFYGGNGSGTMLLAFDPGAKQIVGHLVNSGGEVSHRVVYKSGEQWVEKVSGHMGDGTHIEGNYTVTVLDGGNTHKWTGTTIVGGKKVDELQDIWRRVSDK